MYDFCIVGSGAGAGPIAYELTKSGAKVVILEKGDFYKESDFNKDEIANTRRDILTPNLKDEFHVLESFENGSFVETPTFKSGWSFWNGNVVGGASNFMSGFFHRMHPKDFRLLSEFGAIKGANIANWPISYDELEPFYEKVERVVGVSGKIEPYKFSEPRSTKDFPYLPTIEHPISKLIDKSAKELGINAMKTPRAILTKPQDARDECYYSNYCGSYGCSSGAKGSSRAALLQKALKSKNLTIITNAQVVKLIEKDKSVQEARYIDKDGDTKTIKAKIFVLAAGAVESSRLLLNSFSKNFPNGLANNSGQVGKNLLFTAGGVVSGEFDKDNINLEDLMINGVFVNRTIKDWYFLDDKTKGGIAEILFEHANPIAKANRQKLSDGKLIWGEELQKKIYEKLNHKKQLDFEIFNDWIPHDDCFVTLSRKYRDKYGYQVAKIRITSHPQNIKIANTLAKGAKKILKKMNAKNISASITPYPAQNLQAGGCRFGDDPKTSVLDKNCKAHEVKNLYVSDGSFMPTGGSIPYTWTIYANSFRVAEVLKNN